MSIPGSVESPIDEERDGELSNGHGQSAKLSDIIPSSQSAPPDKIQDDGTEDHAQGTGSVPLMQRFVSAVQQVAGGKIKRLTSRLSRKSRQHREGSASSSDSVFPHRQESDNVKTQEGLVQLEQAAKVMEQRKQQEARQTQEADEDDLKKLEGSKRLFATKQVSRGLFVIVLGIIIGVANVCFHEFMHLIEIVWIKKGGKWFVEACGGNWAMLVVWMTLGCVLSSALVGYLTREYIPECVGGGSIATKICLAVRAQIPIKVAVYRMVCTSFFVGMGNPLGIEAPTLHIASSIASSMHCFFASPAIPFGWRLDMDDMGLHTVLGCTAGLVAAFKSSISGIIYALEEWVSFRGYHSAATLVIASLGAFLSTEHILGTKAVFNANGKMIPTDHDFLFRHYWPWTIASLVTGTVAGLLSVVFSKLAVNVRQWLYSQTFVPDRYIGALAGLLCGLLGGLIYWLSGEFNGNGEHRLMGAWGQGNSALFSVMERNQATGSMIIFVVFKMVSIVIALASGGSGGILMPSLVLGGALGGIVAQLLKAFYNTAATDPVWDCCVVFGMAAFFSAVMRLPLTAAVLTYELTAIYEVHNAGVLQALFASSTVAFLIARSSCHEGLMELLMVQDGISPGALHQQIDDVLHSKGRKSQQDGDIFPIVEESPGYDPDADAEDNDVDPSQRSSVGSVRPFVQMTSDAGNSVQSSNTGHRAMQRMSMAHVLDLAAQRSHNLATKRKSTMDASSQGMTTLGSASREAPRASVAASTQRLLLKGGNNLSSNPQQSRSRLGPTASATPMLASVCEDENDSEMVESKNMGSSPQAPSTSRASKRVAEAESHTHAVIEKGAPHAPPSPIENHPPSPNGNDISAITHSIVTTVRIP